MRTINGVLYIFCDFLNAQAGWFKNTIFFKDSIKYIKESEKFRI